MKTTGTRGKAEQRIITKFLVGKTARLVSNFAYDRLHGDGLPIKNACQSCLSQLPVEDGRIRLMKLEPKAVQEFIQKRKWFTKKIPHPLRPPILNLYA